MGPIAKRLPSILLASLLAGLACAATGPDATSWSSWGNGLRVNNYSPAQQINRSNVGTLHPVWSYELPQHGGWELTPIVMGGLLYGQDLQGNAFALDPETGKEVWRFASGVRGNNRSVAYWPGDATHPPRILMAVLDRIYAIDAATGAAIKEFGGGRGYVNIRDGFAEAGPAYRMTSPPTIYRNLVITGVSTQEFGSKGPPGDPRAYDAVTGKLVWRFHVVPRPGEANFGTWGPEGWDGRSGPTSWGVMSVDEETGSVFIPIGQPADNYVGIDRPGDNLYSDSVIALDANTGNYRWHYQFVHHDLFDYDVSAPPALVDLTVNGQRIPALVEVTKQALMFILDRRTGKPVFGVEERPVPRSTIPGEKNSLTQPFPLKPQPLGKLGVFRADLSTITPEVQRYCTDLWNRMGFRDSPVFTPPSLEGPNLFTPSNAGGLGGVWGGVSVDPATNTIFVNGSNLTAYNYIVPDNGKDEGRGGSSGYRTVDAFTKLMDPNGAPCIQPPWGEMWAVDGNTGDVLWHVPLGKAEVYRDLGEHTGYINYAGSIATAGGLLFLGGTTMACSQCTHDEPVVRALDTRTGLELWRARLSAGTKSNLMTFVGKSGRQYVIATSSGRPNANIAMVAFALARPGDPPVNINVAPLPPSALGPGAASARGPGVARVEDLPAGTGKDDVARTCTMCHALTVVTATPRSLDGWTTSIQDMRARGARLEDPVAKRIASYLAAHFGPRSPGGSAGARTESE